MSFDGQFKAPARIERRSNETMHLKDRSNEKPET